MLNIYPAEEIAKLNEQYKVSECLPGGLLLGSNGGGEGLIMDLRKGSKTCGEFYKVPFIPMIWESAVWVGKSIEDAKKGFNLA